VGGVAIQAYGGQRMTQDLDVVIAASRQNMGRLAAALVDVDGRILGPDGEARRWTAAGPRRRASARIARGRALTTRCSATRAIPPARLTTSAEPAALYVIPTFAVSGAAS
jgi:hypothetical protein